MKKIVEYTAYISLIIAALTASYALIDQRLEYRRRGTPLSPTILINKKLPLADINWKAAHYTVVIAMTTVCHFCKDSLPFYKGLAKLENTIPGQFQMVAVSPEEVDDTTKYLAENQASFDRVRSAPLAGIDVAGTPTTFIVDATGTVRRVYSGELRPKQQQELISYVTKPVQP